MAKKSSPKLQEPVDPDEGIEWVLVKGLLAGNATMRVRVPEGSAGVIIQTTHFVRTPEKNSDGNAVFKPKK